MYNPKKHHRHSIRLRNYDYANTGAYFVTVCLNQSIPKNWRYNANYDFPTFGKIENNTMILNEYGKVAFNEWVNLSKRYPNISFNIFQIMPDHIHGIIQIHNAPTQNATTMQQNIATSPQNPNTTDQNANAPTPDAHPKLMGDIAGNGATVENRTTTRVAPTAATTTVGRIVGAYKSLVSVKCLEISKQKNYIMGKLWQRNYYEHVIRNDTEYSNIVKYIHDNPIWWGKEKRK